LVSTVGSRVEHASNADALKRARARAALIPDLLTESRQIANTAINGWHGRRKRGIGENFWQFRPYVEGETLAKIDWRRSARDDHIYVQDKEWEAAHTLWIWADNSPSMLYKSDLADVSKQSRGMVLALALCELLARSGERIGWPGVSKPIAHRDAAERIASKLIHANVDGGFPPTAQVRRYSELVLFSDFLDPVDEVLERIDAIARRGVRGHIVQIVDPAEESFPYSGRTQFLDPETGNRFIAGRAELLGEEYLKLFEARKQALSTQLNRFGWSHIVHHTDQPASTALVALHLRLGDELSAFGGIR